MFFWYFFFCSIMCSGLQFLGVKQSRKRPYNPVWRFQPVDADSQPTPCKLRKIEVKVTRTRPYKKLTKKSTPLLKTFQAFDLKLNLDLSFLIPTLQPEPILQIVTKYKPRFINLAEFLHKFPITKLRHFAEFNRLNSLRMVRKVTIARVLDPYDSFGHTKNQTARNTVFHIDSDILVRIVRVEYKINYIIEKIRGNTATYYIYKSFDDMIYVDSMKTFNVRFSHHINARAQLCHLERATEFPIKQYQKLT